MGFFSGLIKKVAAPIAGGLLGIGGDAISNSAARDESSASRSFTEKQLKNRHQWEVADLKKAKLNPILSAGGTPSVGSSAMAAQSAMGSSGIKGALAAAQLDNIKADTGLKKSTAKNTDVKTIKDAKYTDFHQDIADAAGKASAFGRSYLKTTSENAKKLKESSMFLKDAIGNKYFYPKKGKN